MKNWKIFDKYIFNQVLGATFVCILLFIVVWIAPEILFRTIKLYLGGFITQKMLFQILIYEIPKILGKALPVGILLGSLFTFDKLSKDFELTVFRGVGLSFWRILRPVIILGSIICVLCFVTYDRLIPYSCNLLNTVKNDFDTSQFVYAQKDKNKKIKEIVIVSKFDYKELKELTVLNFSDSTYNDSAIIKNIIVADYALYNHDRWELPTAKKYNLSKDGVFESIDEVKNVKILEGDKAKDIHQLMLYTLKRDRELDNQQMKNYMKLLKQEDMADEYRFILNKYLQRYFHSLICVLFAILGCLLGFSKPREQKLIGFTIAIGIVFLYYLTLPFFDMLAEKGILPPLVDASIQPIIIFFAILFIKKKKDL